MISQQPFVTPSAEVRPLSQQPFVTVFLVSLIGLEVRQSLDLSKVANASHQPIWETEVIEIASAASVVRVNRKYKGVVCRLVAFVEASTDLMVRLTIGGKIHTPFDRPASCIMCSVPEH